MLSSPFNKLQEKNNKLMQQQQIINQIKAIRQKRILNYRARCIKLQKERQSQQSLEQDNYLEEKECLEEECLEEEPVKQEQKNKRTFIFL
jgi:hypothetical protein